jgi:uncharacterized membrane protein HdeD (DUF308 family)
VFDSGTVSDTMWATMTMYRNLVAGMAIVMILLGIAMLAETAVHGGSVGVILGLLFVAAGAGRLWMMRRRAA